MTGPAADPSPRVQRCQLLAVADRAELVAVAERCQARTGPAQVMAGPEVGVVVLTVREPVESIRLHLAEVLVTRVEVLHRGELGWSARMGDDQAAALAAAVCDAELAAGGPEADLVHELCRRTTAARRADRAAEWADLEPTTVQFEEMA